MSAEKQTQTNLPIPSDVGIEIGFDHPLALHIASASNFRNDVAQLLAIGVAVDKVDDNGVTPLMCASLKGHCDIVALLLAANANVKLTDNRGNSVLRFAYTGGNRNVIDQLIAAGALQGLTTAEIVKLLSISKRLGNHQIIAQLLAAIITADQDHDAQVHNPNTLNEKFILSQNNQVELDGLFIKGDDEEVKLDPANILAKSTFRLVLSYLPLYALTACTEVNSKWRYFANWDDLWKQKFIISFFVSYGILRSLNTQVISWKKQLIAQYSHDYTGFSSTQKKIITHCKEGNLRGICSLVPNIKLLDLTQTDKSGFDSIYYARCSGYTSILQESFVNIVLPAYVLTPEQTSLIYFAIATNQSNQTIGLLIASGFDVHLPGPSGAKALYIASELGNEMQVEQLLAAGSHYQGTPIIDEVQIERVTHKEEYVFVSRYDSGIPHDWEYVKRLTPVTHVEYQRIFKGYKFIPVHAASRGGHLNIVKRLLKAGPENAGKALCHASTWGQRNVVEHLLVTSYKAKGLLNDRVSALYAACYNGYVTIVELLIVARTPVDCIMNDGSTPLLAASRNGHVNVLDCLLAAKAPVDQSGKDGATPLILAAQHGREDVVASLVAAGASVQRTNNAGDTALFVASQNGHSSIVARLLSVNAEISPYNRRGLTPLDIAIANNHIKVIQILALEILTRYIKKLTAMPEFKYSSWRAQFFGVFGVQTDRASTIRATATLQEFILGSIEIDQLKNYHTIYRFTPKLRKIFDYYYSHPESIEKNRLAEIPAILKNYFLAISLDNFEKADRMKEGIQVIRSNYNNSLEAQIAIGIMSLEDFETPNLIPSEFQAAERSILALDQNFDRTVIILSTWLKENIISNDILVNFSQHIDKADDEPESEVVFLDLTPTL